MNSLILLIIAMLFPPLAVLLKDGLKSSFWLNVLLTLLGWLPGVLHAIYVVLCD